MNGKSIYTDGTATFTSGSPAVVGSGTAWTALIAGDSLLGPDGKYYEITVSDDTHLNLDRNYEGTTASGASYVIFKSSTDRDSVRAVSQQLSQLTAAYRSALNMTGDDKILTLNKVDAADLNGILLKTDDLDKIRLGTFGDDNFEVQTLVAAAWTTAFGVNASTGAVSMLSQLLLGSAVTSPVLTGDVNDYCNGLTGYDRATVVKFTTSAISNITGLAGGADGRMVALLNLGSKHVILKNEHSGSTAGNRFSLPTDLTLSAKSCAFLIYDGSTSRWNLVAAQSGLFVLSIAFNNKPSTNEVITGPVFTDTVHFPVNFAGSVAVCNVAPLDDAVFKILKNGVQIGTLTFPAGETTGVFVMATATDFGLNDTLDLQAPNPEDATLSGVRATFRGAR